MTIDALHGPIERPREAGETQLPIGVPDANIFSCPRCARPLAVGASRCVGCGTRLIAGVPLVKATGLLGVGLAAGILVGAGAVGVVTALHRSTTGGSVVPPVAAIPSTAPVPTVALPTAAPVEVGVPSAALTALHQATVVNQRLLADAVLLDAAVEDGASAAEIAQLLRNLASTASFGDRLATTVATWVDGVGVADRLAAFYSSVGRVADDGLSASINNERAYRDAARRMLSVLAGLTDLDAASRGLASSVDVELPPLEPATP